MRTTAWIAILGLLLAAAPALSDPGVGQWVNDKGRPISELNVGGWAVYEFSGSGNSTVLTIKSNVAHVCFDTDTSSQTIGAARASVVLSLSADGDSHSLNAAIVRALPTSGVQCEDVPKGNYWIEVTTPPGGGETPRITATGRGV